MIKVLFGRPHQIILRLIKRMEKVCDITNFANLVRPLYEESEEFYLVSLNMNFMNIKFNVTLSFSDLTYL
jgi:transcriptional regulatory protein LevR